jgi:PAS domain S-box-containing protein
VLSGVQYIPVHAAQITILGTWRRSAQNPEAVLETGTNQRPYFCNNRQNFPRLFLSTLQEYLMEYICSTEDPDLWERYIGNHSSPETTAWLRKFLDVPNVGFAVCDEDLRFTFINHALAQMNGLPAEAHLGKTVQDILGEAAENLLPMFEHVFSTGQPVSFDLATKLPTRTELGYWTENVFPIKDAQGRVKQVGVVVVEVTNQKRSEAGVTERMQRLEALLEFSTSLMSILDEQQLLPLLSVFLQKVVPHDFASIALYDESIRRLRLNTLDSSLALELGDSDPIVGATEAPYGAVFLHGEARFHSRDQLASSDSPLFRQLLEAGVESVCFLPLDCTKEGHTWNFEAGP